MLLVTYTTLVLLLPYSRRQRQTLKPRGISTHTAVSGSYVAEYTSMTRPYSSTDCPRWLEMVRAESITCRPVLTRSCRERNLPVRLTSTYFRHLLTRLHSRLSSRTRTTWKSKSSPVSTNIEFFLNIRNVILCACTVQKQVRLCAIPRYGRMDIKQ